MPSVTTKHVGFVEQWCRILERLSHLRVFVRLAETLSFSKTAATLQVARSTVSKIVQDLEDELGVSLIQRSTRTVSLTPNGQHFHKRCLALIREADLTMQMFETGASTPRGKLRVNVPTRIARKILVPALPQFFERYPNIELDLAATDRAVDLFGEGFDSVIRVGRQKDSGLVSRTIADLSIVNCASASYVRLHGAPASLSELDRHAAVGYVSTSNRRDYGWEYYEGGAYKTKRMACAIRVNNAELYLACCLAGLGLIQVPEFDVRNLVAEGKLIEILPECSAEPMPISLVSTDRTALSPAVDAFGRWAENEIKRAL